MALITFLLVSIRTFRWWSCLLSPTAGCPQMFIAAWESGLARANLDCDGVHMDRSYLDETLSESKRDIARYRRPLKLWRSMERLNPEKRSRGFVFKAPTRAVYALWRRAQRW